MIALLRMRYDQRTQNYVARSTAEVLSKRNILRCLKRFIAREVYKQLTRPPPHTKTAHTDRLTVYGSFIKGVGH